LGRNVRSGGRPPIRSAWVACQYTGTRPDTVSRVTRTAFATLTVLLWAPPAYAQQFIATGRDSLRGLPGVEIR